MTRSMRVLGIAAAGVLVVLLAAGALWPAGTSAAVNAVTASSTTIATGGFAVITIDADEGAGDVRVTATGGTLRTRDQRVPFPCDSIVALPVDLPASATATPAGGDPAAIVPPAPPGCRDVRGEGTADLTIPDAPNLVDVVRVLLVAPSAPATLTVTAIQGSTARPVVITVREETGQFLTGSIPPDGGFGLVVFGGGTFEELVRAARCPSGSPAFWITSRGGFLVYIPAAAGVPAVNADFQAAFPGARVPAGTALIGRCVGQPPASGVEGMVTIGPVCPVMIQYDPRCGDRPFQAALSVLSVVDGRELASVTANAEGRYRLPLAPGAYLLKPLSPPGRPLPTAPQQRFEVRQGAYTRVDVRYDSGIRFGVPAADATAAVAENW